MESSELDAVSHYTKISALEIKTLRVSFKHNTRKSKNI